MIGMYILTLIGVSTTLCIGFYVYFLQRNMKFNELYLLLSLLISFYGINELSIMHSSDFSIAAFHHKMLSFELFIYPIALCMVLVFKRNDTISKWLGLLLFLPALIFLFVDFKFVNINGNLLMSNGNFLRFSQWSVASLISFLWQMSIITIVLVDLYLVAKQDPNKDRRGQASLLFFSFGIMFLLGILGQLIFTNLEMPLNFVKAIGLSLAALFILPAIAKYNLFTLTQKNMAKKIISETSDLIAFIDLDGKVVDANPAFFNLLGLEKKLVINKDFNSLLSQDSLSDITEPLKEHGTIAWSTSLQSFNGLRAQSSEVEFAASNIFSSKGSHLGVLLVGNDKTKELRAASALVEKERRFRMLLNNTDDMIFVYSLEIEDPKCFSEVNNVACEILGYTKQEWSEMTIFDIAVDSVSCKSYLHRLFRDKRILKEIDLKSRAGKIIPFEINSQSIEMDGQKMVVSIARDITERKVTKDMIHVMENAIDSSISSIFFTDLEGVFTWVNESFMHLWGITDDDLVVGHNVTEFFRDSETMLKAIDTTGKFFGELHVIDESRESFIIQIAAHSFKHISGEVIGIMASCIDITSAKEAENALRESKKNYETLVEKSMIAIAVENQNSEIIFFNERLPEILGRSAIEINKIGIPAAIGLTQSNKPIVSPVNLDLEFVTNKGVERFLNADIHPVREDGKTKGWRYYIRDDTDRKRIEKEIQKNEKLEYVGLLAGGIAHDFNNVLTAITGNLGLARMQLERGGDVLKAIKETEEQSHRARLLTDQLLTFSKGGAPIKKDASIKEIIVETVQFALRGTGILAEFDFEENLPTLSFDSGQFSQVMSNLTFNARDAMSEGGKFFVSIAKTLVSQDSVLPIEPGAYLEIVAKDNGPGISKDVLKNVFEPYFTTKEEGHGLGLATCFSIVKRHKGYITVESEKDEGTSFRILMPVSESSELEKTEFPENKDLQLSEGNGKILLMDDDPNIREVAENLLDFLGYEIISTENGEDAISSFQEASKAGKPFDVCIFDLTVPGGMGGKEAIAKIRELDSNVKAIVSSGYSNDPIMSNYEQYGFSDVVAKPYKIEELANSVEKLLKKAS